MQFRSAPPDGGGKPGSDQGRTPPIKVKSILGFRAKGRDVLESVEGYQFREVSAPYNALFGAQKGDMDHQNTCFWEVNNDILM